MFSLDDPELQLRPPPEALRWVEAAAGPGSQVVGVRWLRGGIAASVHAVDVVAPGGRQLSLVLKRCIGDDPSEPDQAGREARVLELVASAPVVTPRLVGLDREGAQCGMPAILMTRLPGHPVLRPRTIRPRIETLAAVLPSIHAAPIRAGDVPAYRPYSIPEPGVPPAWAADPGAWQAAIERVRGPVPDEPACFIHRDYHPGNVLMARSGSPGVIDWLHGSWGPPAADLGHCRINLWRLHGRAVADAFLAAHRRLAPDSPAHDPFWDLAAQLGGLADLDGSTGRPVPDARYRRAAEEIVSAAAARV